MFPASLAACVPLFIATATSACARAGESLVPSPVIATSRPPDWYSRISFSFASGVAWARKSPTPASAILSAVIFNALIIVLLIPLALRGVRYRPVGAATLLRDNLLIYGLGGLLVPFAGIKAIDMLLVFLRLA